MNHISKFICHDLKLNMSRMANKMLYIHGRISECHLCFLLGCAEAFFKVCRSIRNSHTFSAAAKSSLDDDRITDRFGFLHSLFYCKDWIFSARNDRNTCICHCILSSLFVSKTCDHTGRRSDKSNVALLTEFCKATIFGQETKSRMNRIRSCNDRCTDDIFHAEIALG